MKLEIIKPGINGEGIGFYKRKPVIVEGCFPDEVVECDLIDKGNHYIGKLKSIIKKSKYRIQPICYHHKKCGACSLMELNYHEQLSIKKQLLKDALYKYASYEGNIEGIIPSPNIYNYRNKANMPIFNHDGVLVNALYQTNSNRPALIKECKIHDQKIEEIRIKVLDVLNKYHLDVYKNSEKKGLRQLVIRGFNKEYQLVIITGKDILDKNLIKDLSKIKDLVSIYQGVNTHKNPIHMMPDKLKPLYGKQKISFKCDDYELLLSPQAFFQLNKQQAETIYKDVRDLVDDKVDTIVEAYSGIGAISIFLHDKAKQLIGVEIIERAVKDSEENAKLNNIDNISFICDDAPKAIRRIAKNKNIDVLVVDPPRTGLDDELLETIIRSKINKIIYISCNPATLGKDLSVLTNKYNIELVRGYDMFPNTAHVETIVLLTRK